MNFENMRVGSRLLIAGIVVVLGLAGQAGYSLYRMKQAAIDAHSVRLKNLVESARGIVANYQQLETDKQLTRAEAQLQAKEALRPLRYGNDDYFFIYDFDARAIMVAGNPKLEGQQFVGKTDAKGFKMWDAIVEKAKAGSGFIDYAFPRAGQSESKPKLAYVVGIQEWQWALGTGVYIDDVDAAVKTAALGYLGIAVVILGIVAVVSFFVSSSIVRQLGGEPAYAIDMMSRAAAGDLTIEIQASSKGSILESAAKMVGAIRQMVAEIGKSSNSLKYGAEQINTAAGEVALASDRQSEATSSMAAAIEELTVSINHISDSARGSQEDSLASAELAEQGVSRIDIASREIDEIANRVKEAAARIQKLEEGAQQISSIASVIMDIAGQTNLLALNAAIEAARAGEHGRGFAIVADEVRKLAERTSQATVEIEQTIGAIQSDMTEVVEVINAAKPQVEAGVAASRQAEESLRQINAKARATYDRVREVADSTKEQSVASDSVARRVEEIASMVTETTAAMKATSETAQELETIATELNQLVSRFKY